MGRGSDEEERPNYYLVDIAPRYASIVLDEGEAAQATGMVAEADAVRVECQGLIEGADANFNIGSVWKYLFRAGRKQGEEREKDLQKALTYLKFELRRLESGDRWDEAAKSQQMLLEKKEDEDVADALYSHIEPGVIVEHSELDGRFEVLVTFHNDEREPRLRVENLGSGIPGAIFDPANVTVISDQGD